MFLVLVSVILAYFMVIIAKMQMIPEILVIGGLLLVMMELLVGIQTGFDLVLIGSILVVGGLAGMVTGYEVALVVSVILSVIYIAYGRTLVKSKIIVLTHKTNIDKLIGKKAVVVRTITPDTAGLVRVDDEDWRAKSDEVVYEKDKVEIEAIEGVSLKVSKVKNS